MTDFTRRQISGLLGLGAVTAGLSLPAYAQGAKPRVVVIGGGAGGATAARYLAKDSKGAIDVILIEPTKKILHVLLFPIFIWVDIVIIR